MSDDLDPIEKIRKWVDYPYNSPETIVVQSDLVTFTADDLARLLQERDEAAARIRELESELAALREARGVRVKPLVWEDWSAKHRTNYTADTPFGRYGVMQFHFPDMHFKIEPPTGKPFIADTLGAAKAAAQADYERRILAALEPAPVTVGEAARVLLDAWRNSQTIDADEKAQDYADIHECDVDSGRILEPWLRALADAGEAG